jgi:hypothetical protein
MRCLIVSLGHVEVFGRFRIYFGILIMLQGVENKKFQLGANAKQGIYASSYFRCGNYSWLYDQFGFVTV